MERLPGQSPRSNHPPATHHELRHIVRQASLTFKSGAGFRRLCRLAPRSRIVPVFFQSPGTPNGVGNYSDTYTTYKIQTKRGWNKNEFVWSDSVSVSLSGGFGPRPIVYIFQIDLQRDSEILSRRM
ncbi:hypothetical protein F2P81_003325 [Scophthalmus maximus]|uniref:Uncharacterized protein n=1 Tax=Scophthalmus maximus TaxID=52904 RepID=A0A6A4TCF7_SCOMX|nr:hypothetical protein F2P81_003325 [Scophthalmus maximus]